MRSNLYSWDLELFEESAFVFDAALGDFGEALVAAVVDGLVEWGG
jgi:hypothetical protein